MPIGVCLKNGAKPRAIWQQRQGALKVALNRGRADLAPGGYIEPWGHLPQNLRDDRRHMMRTQRNQRIGEIIVGVVQLWVSFAGTEEYHR